MSNKQLNLHINPLVDLVADLVKCGKNAVYKAKDIAYRTIQSALDNQSLEAMFKLTKYLSADRMLKHLHNITKDKTKKLIKQGTANLKLPKSVSLAIDFHEKEYYGDKNHIGVIGSKGGKYVRRLIELSCVSPALFLNAVPVTIFNNNKVKLIKQFLDEFNASFPKSSIGLLLIDRGFFTKAVVNCLVRRKIPFIMPAIRNKAIQKLIKQYKQGKLPQKVRYKFGYYYVTLAFLKVGNEVFVYITNTKHRAIKLHLLYSKRWQIETNFREQNKFSFLTKTTDFDLRYFAFAIAGLLFNAWQITRKKLNHIKESYLYKYIASELILSAWQTIAKSEVVKNLDYFLLA